MSNTDPVQSPLSLLLPLDPSVDLNAVLQQLKQNQAILGQALNNIHTVHFARFMLLDNNKTLALFTEFDGDFETYVKDFVAQLGPVFDGMMAFVTDPAPTPIADHVDEFVAWINQHNAPVLTFYSAYPTLRVVDILGQSS